MIARHETLIEEGWLSRESEVGWQETVSNMDSQISLDEDLVEIEAGNSKDRHLTGGRACYQPTGRWQPAIRQRRRYLTGEPVGPQRGESTKKARGKW